MSTLADLLQQQHQRLDRLTELLVHERALLGVGQVDGTALEAVAEDKRKLLTALEEGEQQRRAVCRLQGPDVSLAADLAAAQAQGCGDTWQRMRERAGQAQRANRLNGELIQARLSNNQHLLNELQALAGKDLYGPDGQARGGQVRVSSRA